MNIEVCENTKPRLKRFSEKRDLSALTNIQSWCREMSLSFDNDILNKNLESDKTFHWLLNAYPLILAYQGKTQESEDFLKKVISYWSGKYDENKNTQNLSNLVDPSINLLRLYKLTNKDKEFSSALKNMNVVFNEDEVSLGNIIVNKNILGDRWDILYVAALDEILKSYLLESNYHRVLEIQARLSEQHIESDVYLEAKIVSLISLDMFEEAIKLCRHGMSKSTCIKNGIYAYRLYEAFKGMGEKSKAQSVMQYLISNMEKTTLDSLSKLTFSSNIIEEVKLPSSNLLVQNTLRQYNTLKDEFNYGMTLCNLQGNHPDKKHKQQLKALYKHTHYIVLRKAIEKKVGITGQEPSENLWLPKISSSLNNLIS